LAEVCALQVHLFVICYFGVKYGDLMQVKGHAEVMGKLLDHGADVNKMTDDGVTALTATLALLLGDGPAVRRQELTPPGPPSAVDQIDEGSVDSVTTRVGQLTVVRVNRDVVDNLLNESPLPPPTVYFDAAGQMQTPAETADRKAMDRKADVDQKPKVASAAQQQQQQQLLKPQSAGGKGSGRPSPASSSKVSAALNIDVGSATSHAVSERSNQPAAIIDEKEQR